MKKIGFFLAMILLFSGGCGGGPSEPRDVSTTTKAILGRWRDKNLWGWEYHFNRDGTYKITVNSAPSYEGRYEVSEEDPANRRITLSLKGQGQSRGTDLAAQGAFSQDYRTFTGKKEDIVNGNVVTPVPKPFSWRYVGPL